MKTFREFLNEDRAEWEAKRALNKGPSSETLDTKKCKEGKHVVLKKLNDHYHGKDHISYAVQHWNGKGRYVHHQHRSEGAARKRFNSIKVVE